jgi:hypothetical protein
MSEQYDNLPNVLQMKFIKYLIPYFKKHTIVSAACVAGFVGAITQLIILNTYPFPSEFNLKNILMFLIVSFVISALIGFPMKLSNLFPHLENTYYKQLGSFNGAIHDGISGIIVQITLLIIFLINHKIH